MGKAEHHYFRILVCTIFVLFSMYGCNFWGIDDLSVHITSPSSDVNIAA